MKELITKTEHIRQIEFWAATAIFVFAVFFHISAALSGGAEVLIPHEAHTGQAGIPAGYYRNYFVPQLAQYVMLYVSFLLLNFLVVPRLLKREAVALQIFLLAGIISLLGAGLGTADTYIKHHLFRSYGSRDAAWAQIFRESMLYACWLGLVFGFYTVLKYAGSYLLTHAADMQRKYPFITPAGLGAFVFWMMGLFFLIALRGDREVIAFWAVFFPAAILFYWFAFHALIPASLKKKRPFGAYFIRSLGTFLLAVWPICITTVLITNDPEDGMGIGMFVTVFHMLIIVPFMWIMYKRKMKGAAEINVLKEEIGRSHASIDFLRSQINPHFLFNALNTIYGTAIQEKAERTGEGVQRLGDMMRFMLQENMQEKISLAREIEYLDNYISLQRLRTDPAPGVQIKTDIADPAEPVQIAPMLLIPFVENAFKHGISLREPSYIRITLELKERTLYFDVHNSRHPKSERDPEKHSGGIGLQNVRQRLQLLYPELHELIIRETGKEYFVHLTVQL